MSYRDDVDTLYTRAMVLQRELDAAAEKLAQRDAELAQLRGTSFSREDTSPGIRLLRDLPDPDQVLSRLVSTSEREQKAIDEVENAPFLSDDKVKEILPEPPPHPRL